MFRFIFSACFLSFATAIIIRNSPCDWENIDSVRNLNITELLGEWHLMQRIENPLDTGECSTLTLAVETTNATSYVSVTHKEVHGTHVHHTTGRMNLVNATLGVFNMNYANFSYNAVALGVNYTNYALLYSCSDINANQSSVVAWAYSRTTSLKDSDKLTIDGLVKSNGDLQNATWIVTQHTKAACNTNAGIAVRISPVVILLAVFLAGKNVILSN